MDCFRIITTTNWCPMPNWSQLLRRRYSRREKVLISFMVLSIVIFVFSVFMLTRFQENVCYTPECIEATYHITKSIDPSVQPCQNFFEFACGTFLNTAIQDDSLSTFKDLERRRKRTLKQLVIGDQADESKLSTSFQNQRRFFRSCMNTTAIEADEDKTFLRDVEDVLGGWPLLQGYSNNFHWTDVMIRAKRKGVFFKHFINIKVQLLPETSSLHLEVSPPTPFSYYLDNLWNAQNADNIVKIAALWGNVSEDAALVVNQTAEFAHNLLSIVERVANDTMAVPIQQQKLAIHSLNNLQYPKIDWLTFLQNLTGLNLKRDEVIIYNIDEKYFKDLHDLTQNTSTKIWANYIATELVMDECRFLSKRIEALCMKILPLMMTFSNRQDICLHKALTTFEGVADAEYVRKYVSKETREKIGEMVENIKEEMINSLRETTFMDKATKKGALEHLGNITTAIGWTDLVFNKTEYERLFVPVKVKLSSDNIIQMSHEVNRLIIDNEYAKLKKPFSFQIEHAYSVPKLAENAFFVKYLNLLILAAPILQEPVYDLDRPEYLNYGALGSIIGHELTHAFTPDVASHPSFGTVAVDYWTNETHRNFNNRKKCINEEYEKYAKSIGVTLENSSASLDENIADFNGAILAYRAYQKWVTRHGVEEKLPGLDFTPNQFFWIMSSTYMCKEPKVDDPQQAYSYSYYEPARSHAMDSFRVVGTIRYSSYFGQDFGCPRGSDMNPVRKCKIFA